MDPGKSHTHTLALDRDEKDGRDVQQLGAGFSYDTLQMQVGANIEGQLLTQLLRYQLSLRS